MILHKTKCIYFTVTGTKNRDIFVSNNFHSKIFGRKSKKICIVLTELPLNQQIYKSRDCQNNKNICGSCKRLQDADKKCYDSKIQNSIRGYLFHLGLLLKHVRLLISIFSSYAFKFFKKSFCFSMISLDLVFLWKFELSNILMTFLQGNQLEFLIFERCSRPIGVKLRVVFSMRGRNYKSAQGIGKDKILTSIPSFFWMIIFCVCPFSL